MSVIDQSGVTLGIIYKSWKYDEFEVPGNVYPHGMVPPSGQLNVHEQYTVVESRFTVGLS